MAVVLQDFSFLGKDRVKDTRVSPLWDTRQTPFCLLPCVCTVHVPENEVVRTQPLIGNEIVVGNIAGGTGIRMRQIKKKRDGESGSRWEEIERESRDGVTETGGKREREETEESCMTNKRVCLKTEGTHRFNLSCPPRHVLAKTWMENQGEKKKVCGKERKRSSFYLCT